MFSTTPCINCGGFIDLCDCAESTKELIRGLPIIGRTEPAPKDLKLPVEYAIIIFDGPDDCPYRVITTRNKKVYQRLFNSWRYRAIEVIESEFSMNLPKVRRIGIFITIKKQLNSPFFFKG